MKLSNIERDKLEEEIKSYSGMFTIAELDKGNTIYMADIGSQRNDGKWENFIAPMEANIIESRIDFNDITLLRPETHGFEGGEFTFKTDVHRQFSFQIDNDGDMLKPKIRYNGYQFIDTDLDRLKERFYKEILRIITGDWAGVKGVKQSTAIKDALKEDPTEFFSSKHPEMVI